MEESDSINQPAANLANAAITGNVPINMDQPNTAEVEAQLANRLIEIKSLIYKRFHQETLAESLILIFISLQELPSFLGLLQKSVMPVDKTELLRKSVLSAPAITDLVQTPVILAFLTDLSHYTVIVNFQRSRLQKSDRPNPKPPEIHTLNRLPPWESLFNCEVTFDHTKIYSTAISVHNIKQPCVNSYYPITLQNLPGKPPVLSPKTPQHDLAHECDLNSRYLYNPQLWLDSTIVVSSEAATLKRQGEDSQLTAAIPQGDMDKKATCQGYT